MERMAQKISSRMELQTVNNIKTKKRQVNIELLRMIAMVLVLLTHTQFGKGDFSLVYTDLLRAIGNYEVDSWTFVCVPSFVVISGYFGIHWKWKGLFNYLFQIGFWGGMIYLITWCFGLHDFQPLAFAKNVTCFLSGVNWFFYAYFGLYMFAPVLNAFIEKVDEKQMMWMTLAFFAFQTVFGWMLKQGEFYYGLTFTSLIGWYLLGAWLKKSSWKGFHLKPWQNMAVFLGVGQLCVLIALAAAFMGVDKGTYSYISPLQVIQTTYLFLFCRSLTVTRGEKIITFFASSAFAGLLAHSWEGSELYGMGMSWVSTSFPVPFVFAMIYICLFFAAACCLDKVRLWCWKSISKICFK